MLCFCSYVMLIVLVYVMLCHLCYMMECGFFFFKQKTAYEMRISDWSSDVCSSDLRRRAPVPTRTESTSGGDFGSVWQTRAFELAGLEEARDENLEPFSDRGEIISTTFGFRKSNRPFTQFVMAPRLPGTDSDFCRAHALSTDIETGRPSFRES